MTYFDVCIEQEIQQYQAAKDVTQYLRKVNALMYRWWIAKCM